MVVLVVAVLRGRVESAASVTGGEMVVLELELELEPDLLSTRSGSRALVLLGGGMLGVYRASWLHIGRGLLPDCSGVGGEVAARLAPTCAVGVGVSVGGVMRRARTLVGVAAVVVTAAAAPPPDGGVSSLLPLLLLDRKSGLATHLADSTSSSICDSVRYQSVWEGSQQASQRTYAAAMTLPLGWSATLAWLLAASLAPLERSLVLGVRERMATP